MIAVDTNLLVYAHREDTPWHAEALRLITALAEGPAAWAIPWPCVHEFLAVVTHPRIYRPPTPMPVALSSVRAWMGSPSLRMIGEGVDHLDRLEELAVRGKVAGAMIHDTRIAAICLAHGVRQLWSADRDFSRFPSLHVKNPLVSGVPIP